MYIDMWPYAMPILEFVIFFFVSMVVVILLLRKLPRWLFNPLVAGIGIFEVLFWFFEVFPNTMYTGQ